MKKMDFYGVGPKIGRIFIPWLALTSSLVGFILLKVHVKKECQMLDELFGEEYLKYKRETPEFVPLPIKKWFWKK